MGHIEQHHIVERLAQQMGTQLLFPAFGNSDHDLIAKLFKKATINTFSRAQEREADQFAFKILTRSHISPDVVSVFFKRLQQQYGSPNESIFPTQYSSLS